MKSRGWKNNTSWLQRSRQHDKSEIAVIIILVLLHNKKPFSKRRAPVWSIVWFDRYRKKMRGGVFAFFFLKGAPFVV